MTRMEFFDAHNEIAMLQKPKQSAGFNDIVDFLKSSHIAHALTVNPTIYVEHQRQFWENAAVVTENGIKGIRTRVCDKPLMITEDHIRTSLQLDDESGITSISNEELFQTIKSMGYDGPEGVFKFYKAKFYTQWRFFAHTLMHCMSKKTTGWSEFSTTIAYGMVCLATARRFNFSLMIFTDLVANLESKKKFFMYPRFVQEVITKALTDLPQFDEVYVPKPPKGKVFSNMKRSSNRDSEGVDTPLFSTMMVVSHNQEGMASGSRPSLDQPTDDQTPPSYSTEIPQSILNRPNPSITKMFSRRKVHKVPSLDESPTTPAPKSPLMDHSPFENIDRESTGVSPNPKKVHTKEKVVHVSRKAATTSASKEKASGKMAKTFLTATLKEKSLRGPRCQETKGTGSASARQKTPVKTSSDSLKGVKASDKDEDRYNYDELMTTMGNINLDVMSQNEEIKELKKVVLYQQKQLDRQQKVITKLLHRQKKASFVLRRRRTGDDAPKKGEKSVLEAEDTQVEGEEEKVNETVSVQIDETAQDKGEIELAKTEDDELMQEAESVKEAETSTAAVSERREEAETTPAAETVSAAGIGKEAVKEPAVETVTTADVTEAAKTVNAAESHLAAVTIEEALTAIWEEVVTEALEEAVLRKTEIVKAAYLKTARVKDAAETLIAEVVNEIVKRAVRKAAECVIENKRKKEAEFEKEDAFVEDDESVQEKEETLGESLKSLKRGRTKSIATKKQRDVKKPRVESVEEKPVEKKKFVKKPRGEPIHERSKSAKKKEKKRKDEATQPNQPSQPSSAQPQSHDECDMYITVVDTTPIQANPLSSKPPEIIFWDIIVNERKEFIRVKRADGKFEASSTWGRILRGCSRSDLEELYEVGIRLYESVLKGPGYSLQKLILERLCMMFNPEAVQNVIKQDFQTINKWILYENCGVYSITIDNLYQEFYLADAVYNHSKEKLDGMLNAKLVCNRGSEMGKFLVKRTINQSVGLDPNMGVYD